MTTSILRPAASPLTRLETQVLVIGAGGAGMYAAHRGRTARRAGAAGRSQPDRPRRRDRHGADDRRRRRSAPEAPDHWEHHLADTLAAGRGLCDARLVAAAVRGRRRGASARWIAGASAGRARTARISAGAGAGARPAALRLRRFPQHRPGGVEDAAHAAAARRRGIRRIGDLLVVDLAGAATAPASAPSLSHGERRAGADRRARRPSSRPAG